MENNITAKLAAEAVFVMQTERMMQKLFIELTNNPEFRKEIYSMMFNTENGTFGE